MNRKLGRLLRPGMGSYFFVMAAFCAATLLEGNYLLAAAEASVTLLVFMLYVTNRNRRDRQIQKYIEDEIVRYEKLSKNMEDDRTREWEILNEVFLKILRFLCSKRLWSFA